MLIAIILAGVLVVALIALVGAIQYNESRRRGAGNATVTTPPPAGAGTDPWHKRGTKMAVAAFKKGAAALAVLFAFFVAYYVLGVQYPESVASYKAHGGPVWPVVLLVIAIAIVTSFTKGKLQQGLIWALSLVLLTIVLPPLLQTDVVQSLTTSKQIAGNGGGQAAIVVSVGPRCDGVLHTIKLDENFQPIHAGCKVEWGINDNSPQKCIVLVDANSDQLDPPACSGSERDFAGIPITGWQSANGEVLLDVIYR